MFNKQKLTRLYFLHFPWIVVAVLMCFLLGGAAAQTLINGNQIQSHTVKALQLDTPGVTAATYGDATHVGQFAVAADGRLTSATNVAITGGGGGTGTPGALVLISQIVTSGSQATVDFASIPATYRNLIVMWQAADTQAGTNSVSLNMKVNADGTAANYTGVFRYGSQNTATFGSNQAPTTSGIQVGFMPQSGNTSMLGSGEVSIFDYTNTSFHKRVNGWANGEDGTTNGTEWSFNSRWKNTAAVNELTFLAGGTAFQNGTVFSLYGVTSSTSSSPTNGALVLLEQHTASASATVDFTQFSTTYDEYIIEYMNVVPATNNVSFELLMSTNGGSSYDTTAGHYKYASYITNDTGAFSTNSVGSNSAAFIQMAANLSNLADGTSGTMRLWNPQQTASNHAIDGNFNYLNNDTNRYRGMMTGYFAQTTAYNAVRFVMSAGNVSSGTFRMYGVSNVLGSGGSAAGKVLLEQHTASTSTSLDFTTCISSSYDSYEFEFLNVLPATTGSTLNLRMSTDGGVTYDAGANYRHAYTFSNTNNAGGTSGSNGETGMVFMGGITNTASDGGGSGYLRMFNPASTNTRQFEFGSSFRFTDTFWYHIHGAGQWTNTTTAANAVRFLMSAGNITSGTIRCYGMGK
jgi:hypothetical protein